MAFFNTEVPLISRKPAISAELASSSLWRVQWQIGAAVLWSAAYTRHDQACLGWGILTASIFTAAQFLPLNWMAQAVIASGLTALGCAAMAWLTWRYTHVDQLAWILYTWLMLMLLGTVVTDFSLWCGWGLVLMQLCPLWLGLCGIGYAVTGLGMRSRLILLCSAAHFLAIGLLPLAGSWQTLLTGVVISGCVIALAEFQWDSNEVCHHLLSDFSHNHHD